MLLCICVCMCVNAFVYSIFRMCLNIRMVIDNDNAIFKSKMLLSVLERVYVCFSELCI